MAKRPTIQELRDNFAYDPEAGTIKWRTNNATSHSRAGRSAGTITAGGYLQLTLGGYHFAASVAVWAVETR
jgi:hypothetical protein